MSGEDAAATLNGDGGDAGALVCFATHGHDHLDGARIRTLLAGLAPREYPFDHRHRVRSALGLLALLRRTRPRLVVMEGTGLAGGLTLLLARALLGTRYIVSSGDAVGPYLALRAPGGGAIGTLYERALCRGCAGFVGWTPYLAGRALSFGAPRAMTAAGWSVQQAQAGARARVRGELGIAPDALVVGLTGAINRSRRGYVYGSELVAAARRASRADLVVCVVGDGNGLDALRELAGEDLGSRVLLPGRVASERVADHLAAFDVASISQSTDQVGAFRYTNKLSDYLAAGLPVITGMTPMSYDLDEGWLWRLPGAAPWSPEYLDALVELLEGLTAADVAEHREAAASRREDPFALAAQQRRMEAFVGDLLASA